MTTEILNIEYHTNRLILKALNTSVSTTEAAGRLGITRRAVYTYCRERDIRWDTKKREYVCSRKIFVTVNEPS